MPQTFTRTDGLVPVDLVHCGLDHMTAALVLFDTDPSHYDSAGYLAHIGVELLLKGWLLETAGSFKGSHKLGPLYQELVEYHGAPRFSGGAAAILETLDSYEVLRYPNRDLPTEVGNEVRASIEELVGEICGSMPQSIQEALAKVKPGTKAGRILMRRRIDSSAGDT